MSTTKKAKETPHVSISSRGSEHIASAVIGTDRLSSTAFAGQREAHRRADARWDGGSRSWVCPRPRLARLLIDLRALGLEVRLSDELAQTVSLAPQRKVDADA